MMENIILAPPNLEHETEAEEYVSEFLVDNSHVNGSAGLPRYKGNYKNWLDKIKNDRILENNDREKIPANTFFAIRKNDNKIVGTVNIRYKLNEKLLKRGGHVGYSVRPFERRKGYATEILFLALLKLREMNVNNVLITCDKENIGSVKTIQKNNGILENEILDSETNKIIQRYWINLDSIR